MVEKGQRDLLLDFYQRLKQAGSANKALRQAQLAMLRQPQRRHPYYWAGLVLSGYYPELEKKP
jgi:CHAT domain-containing protein